MNFEIQNCFSCLLQQNSKLRKTLQFLIFKNLFHKQDSILEYSY